MSADKIPTDGPYPAPAPSLWLRGLAFVCLLLLGVGYAGMAQAQPQNDDPNSPSIRFLQIGTGPTGGTYFPLGGLIANAISNPPGARACERGGSCGVPGIIAVAQSTSGSASNIAAVSTGREELALAQADLVHWAFHGQEIFKEQGADDHLRAIAMLFQEKVHVVVRKGSGLHSLMDLKGKRVSVGENGSGTQIDAMLILRAFGLNEKNLSLSYLRPGSAVDALKRGEIDAFFFISAPPIAALSGLSEGQEIELLPIDGPAAQTILQKYPFFATSQIEADVYPGVGGVTTLSVGAMLICQRDLPDQLIYSITKALFHPTNQKLFRQGHRAGREITLDTARKGLSIPLHPGAERYYFDAGHAP